jgi:tRNA(Ile)-lysidine synthase
VNELIDRVEQVIARRQLLPARKPVLVGVSGGTDSIVLLHVLHTLAPKHRWRLVVAHFNHRSRAGSDADQHFTAETAGKLGLHFETGSADVRQFAAAQKLSFEMAARKLRHEFLAATARNLGIKHVALAHHIDDQVELFFLRVMRGAGSRGLGGMEWSVASPASPNVQLVRPLLGETKSALSDFAREHQVPFREDPTNASTDILRNHIRHVLLPLLRRDFQPEIDRAVLRTMELIRDEGEFVNRQALRWLQTRRRCSFASLHVALQRRILQIEMLGQGIVPQFDHVETLRARAGEWLAVGIDMICRRNEQGTVELRRRAHEEFSPAERMLDIRKSGRTAFKGLNIQWQLVKRRAIAQRTPSTEVFDADLVGKSIVLRHWRAGDRFQPIGMKSAVKLQDYFVNQKVSRDRRHQLTIAATRDNEIFWIEGLRIGERFKVTASTRRLLRWRWRRLAKKNLAAAASTLAERQV